MKRIEHVYWEILAAVENGTAHMTQKHLAEHIGISLSTVHHGLQPLRAMGAVRIKLRGFEIVNPKKILLYWASVRNLGKDILYQTRVDVSPTEIEKRMPGNIVFGAYSAYKFLFNSVPADYSEVYVYARDIAELQKRFPVQQGPPNLFVLGMKVPFTTMTRSHLFVDLWNLREWYARDFLKELEGKMHGILARYPY